MTESTGKRPRIVASFIDETPRTLTQWAKFLGINNQTLRDRQNKHGGSLIAAVYALHDGSEPAFKKGMGLCRLGHEVKGDNLLLRIEKGVEQKRCKKCYYKPPKPRKPKKVRAKKPPRFATFTIESIDAEARTVSAWARYAGVDDLILRKHLKRGLSLGEAVKGLKDGTLRRRTKDNPAGYRPVHVNARRHHCVIARVDNIARGIREWAEYLGIKFATLNKRVDKGMTLEEAVAFTLDDAWTVHNTGGKCRRGHEQNEKNSRLMTKPDGSTQRVCVICQRENARVSGKLKRAREREAKPKTDMCKKGVHKMVGANRMPTMYADGVLRYACRACRYQYQNRRNALKRAGNWKSKEDFGKTLAEKIEINSRREGECVIWMGTLDANRLPKCYYKDGNGTAQSVLVRSYLWQQRYGKPFPRLHGTKTSCGNRLCIADAHVLVVPLRELTHSQEARAKAAAARAVPLGRRADDIARRAMVYANDIRALVHRRGGVAANEADDIVQEVVLRVCQSWQRGESFTSLRAFVMTIARNYTEDTRGYLHRRGYGRNRSFEEPDETDIPLGDTLTSESLLFDDPAVLIERMDTWRLEHARYRARLNQMTPAARRAFEQKAQGLSQAEIAAKFGRSENTIEQLLGRAYKVMRGRFNSKDFELLYHPDRALL